MLWNLLTKTLVKNLFSLIYLKSYWSLLKWYWLSLQRLLCMQKKLENVEGLLLTTLKKETATKLWNWFSQKSLMEFSSWDLEIDQNGHLPLIRVNSMQEMKFFPEIGSKVTIRNSLLTMIKLSHHGKIQNLY